MSKTHQLILVWQESSHTDFVIPRQSRRRETEAWLSFHPSRFVPENCSYEKCTLDYCIVICGILLSLSDSLSLSLILTLTLVEHSHSQAFSPNPISSHTHITHTRTKAFYQAWHSLSRLGFFSLSLFPFINFFIFSIFLFLSFSSSFLLCL